MKISQTPIAVGIIVGILSIWFVIPLIRYLSSFGIWLAIIVTCIIVFYGFWGWMMFTKPLVNILNEDTSNKIDDTKFMDSREGVIWEFPDATNDYDAWNKLDQIICEEMRHRGSRKAKPPENSND